MSIPLPLLFSLLTLLQPTSRAQAPPDAPGWVAVSGGVDTDIYSIDVVSPSEMWAAGYAFGTGDARILSTRDGGRNWEVVRELAQHLLFGIEATADGQIVAVGQRGLGDNGIILTSLDGGETWTETVLPSTFGLYDIELSRNGLAFACGWNGAIYRSLDSGLSWTKLATGTSSSVFKALSSVSPNTIFALGGSAFQGKNVWRSQDSGQSWTKVKQFGGTRVFADLHFFDESRGLVVGGDIFLTEDGGVTWSKVLDSAGILQAVRFRGNVGCTVSSNGTAYRSEDCGATWSAYPPLSGFPVLLSCAPRGSHGMIAGSGLSVFYHWIPAKTVRPHEHR